MTDDIVLLRKFTLNKIKENNEVENMDIILY
jgi:broad-specificity NMP kinase